jgi:hypothetical protein
MVYAPVVERYHIKDALVVTMSGWPRALSEGKGLALNVNIYTILFEYYFILFHVLDMQHDHAEHNEGLNNQSCSCMFSAQYRIDRQVVQLKLTNSQIYLRSSLKRPLSASDFCDWTAALLGVKMS